MTFQYIQHGGAVAMADPSPNEAFGDQRLFCVEFARSPHSHMGLFQVLQVKQWNMDKLIDG